MLALCRRENRPQDAVGTQRLQHVGHRRLQLKLVQQAGAVDVLELLPRLLALVGTRLAVEGVLVAANVRHQPRELLVPVVLRDELDTSRVYVQAAQALRRLLQRTVEAQLDGRSCAALRSTRW